MLGRLDEDSELGPANDYLSSTGARSGTKARPVTRRSISRELFDPNERPSAGATSSQTSARPVTRRSVSRELFDPSQFGGVRRREDFDPFIRGGGIGPPPLFQRERSLTRELDALAGIDPLSPPPHSSFFGKPPGGSSR